MKKLITLTALLLCAVVSSWGAKVTWTPSSSDVSTLKATPFYFTVGTGVNSFRIYGCRASKDQKNEWNETYSGLQTTDNSIVKSGLAVYVPSTSNAVSRIKVTMLTTNSRKVYYSSGDKLPTGNPSTTITLTTEAAEYEPWDAPLAKEVYYAVGGQSGGGGNVVITKIEVEFAATNPYTVTFNAGTNGTCGTTSATESSAGDGVTLPVVTPNSGYVFNGWFTAASDGTKAGVAGNTYYPTEDITLYAQYSAEAAPTIEIDNYSPSTNKDVAKTFTATATGAPTPTVTWYQSATAATSGGTEVGTGSTYKPDVTAEGTFYYYAVASNGIGSDATSSLITLTVTDPNKYVSGNAYYMSEGETPVPNEKIFADDITMQFVNGNAGESFTAGVEDLMINGINANYVASVTGTPGNNNWKARFTPAANGKLSVGVVINKNKTFSITNVSSFKYEGKNGASENVSETVESNSLTTPNGDNAKLYVVVTVDVESGTTYDFSVSGSKMGFYGFEFTPTVTIPVSAAGYATFYTDKALDFTGIEDITAYTATKADNIVTFNKVIGAVPALTGLLVKADEGNYPIPVAASAEGEKGIMVGMLTNTTIEEPGIFVLMNGAQGVGFYKTTTAFTVSANTAYLPADVVAGARQFIGFDEEGEATGIEAIERVQTTDTFFNLNGQRVAAPQKGLYIVNGKKVVLK